MPFLLNSELWFAIILDAPNDAADSELRIRQKYEQTSIIVGDFENVFTKMDEIASNHRWHNSFFDWFYSPQFDSSSIGPLTSKASQKLDETHSHMNSYRLNSASVSAREGIGYAQEALVALEIQEGIHRGIDASRIALAVLIPSAVIGAWIMVRRFRPQ